uniref:Uncharacterized protein n=1 Tax=Glossina pallidipes TaxID=7398 RepID=A0A1A9ZV98_GLOPL
MNIFVYIYNHTLKRTMVENNFHTILVSTWAMILFLLMNSCVPAAVSKSETSHSTNPDDPVASLLSSALKSLGDLAHDEPNKLKPKLKYSIAESHYYPPARPHHEPQPISPPSRPYPYQHYPPPRLYYVPQPIQLPLQRYPLPIERYGQRYPSLIISPAGQLYPQLNLFYLPRLPPTLSNPSPYDAPLIVSPAQYDALSIVSPAQYDASSIVSPDQYDASSVVSPAQFSAQSQCILCVVHVQTAQNSSSSPEPRSPQLPSSISDSQPASDKASILELPPHQLPPLETGLAPLSQPSQEKVTRQSSSSESPSKPAARQSSLLASDSESALSEQSSTEHPLRQLSLSDAALEMQQSPSLGSPSLQPLPSRTHPGLTTHPTQLSELYRESLTPQAAPSISYSQSSPHLSVSLTLPAMLIPHQPPASTTDSEQTLGKAPTSKTTPHHNPPSDTSLEQGTRQLLMPQLLPVSSERQTPLFQPSHETVPLQSSSSQSPSKTGTSQPSPATSDSESTLGKQSSPQPPLCHPMLSEEELQPPVHQSAPLGPGSFQSFPSQTQPESTNRPTQLSEPSQERSTLQPTLSEVHSLSAPHQLVSSVSSAELTPHPSLAATLDSQKVSGEELISKLPPYQNPASETALVQETRQLLPSQLPPVSSARPTPLPQPSHETVPLRSSSSQSPSKTGTSQSSSSMSDSESTLGKRSSPQQSLRQPSLSEEALQPPVHQSAPLGPGSLQSFPSQTQLESTKRPTQLSEPSSEPPSNTAASQSSPSISDSQQPLRQPSLSKEALQPPLHQSAPLGPGSLESLPSQTNLESTKRPTQLSEPSQETSTLQSAPSEPHSLSAPHQSVSSASSAELTPHSSSAAIPGSEQVLGKELASKLPPHQKSAPETASQQGTQHHLLSQLRPESSSASEPSSQQETQHHLLSQLRPESSVRGTPLSQPSQETVPRKSSSSESPSTTAASQSSPSISDSESTLGKQPSPQQPLRQPSLSEEALQPSLHQSIPLGQGSFQSFPPQTLSESANHQAQPSEPSQETLPFQSTSSEPHSLSAPHQSVSSALSAELTPHSSSAAIAGSGQVLGKELASKLPPHQKSAPETASQQGTQHHLLSQLRPELSVRETPLSQPSQETVTHKSSSSESPSTTAASQSSPSISDSESTLGKRPSSQQTVRQPLLSEAPLESPVHQSAPLGPGSLQSFPSQTNVQSTKRPTQLSEPSQETSTLQSASSESHSLSPPHQSVSSASSEELTPHMSSAGTLDSKRVSAKAPISQPPPHQRPQSETALEQGTRNLLLSQPPSGLSISQKTLTQPSDGRVPLQSSSSQSPSKTGTSQSSLLTSDSESTSHHQSAPLGPGSPQPLLLQSHSESTKHQSQLSEPSSESVSSRSYSQLAPHQSVSSASSAEVTPHQSSSSSLILESISGTSKRSLNRKPPSETALEQDAQPKSLQTPLPESSPEQVHLSRELVTPQSTPDKVSSAEQSPLQPRLKEAGSESILHQSTPLATAASQGSLPSQSHLESTTQQTSLSEPSQKPGERQPTLTQLFTVSDSKRTSKGRTIAATKPLPELVIPKSAIPKVFPTLRNVSPADVDLTESQLPSSKQVSKTTTLPSKKKKGKNYEPGPKPNFGDVYSFG